MHDLFVIEPGFGGADRLAGDVVFLEERDPLVAIALEKDLTSGGEERAPRFVVAAHRRGHAERFRVAPEMLERGRDSLGHRMEPLAVARFEARGRGEVLVTPEVGERGRGRLGPLPDLREVGERTLDQ